MYRDIRNNILLKAHGKITFRSLSGFPSRDYQNSKKDPVFLSTGRIQFHVIHYSDPEQFPNSNHFTCLTACLISVICCYGND